MDFPLMTEYSNKRSSYHIVLITYEPFLCLRYGHWGFVYILKHVQ